MVDGVGLLRDAIRLRSELVVLERRRRITMGTVSL